MPSGGNFNKKLIILLMLKLRIDYFGFCFYFILRIILSKFVGINIMYVLIMFNTIWEVMVFIVYFNFKFLTTRVKVNVP